MTAVPYRLHDRTPGADGAPRWSAAFAARMEHIKGPDWWRFPPITYWLEQRGYGLGLLAIRTLMELPDCPLSYACAVCGLSKQGVKRYVEMTWRVAYTEFSGRFPGLFYRNYGDDLVEGHA